MAIGGKKSGIRARNFQETYFGSKRKQIQNGEIENTNRVEFNSIKGFKLGIKRKADKEDTHFFDAVIIEHLLDIMQDGSSLTDAAKMVYLPVPIVERWYSDNYRDFRFAVDQVESFQKHLQVRKVLAGVVNWTASAWWLERQHKSEYQKGYTGSDMENPDQLPEYIQIGSTMIKF